MPENSPEYDGPEAPPWFKEGAEVRVKNTPALRKLGILIASTRDFVWPREVGTLRKASPLHGETWHWAVEFPLGRTHHVLRPEDLEPLIRHEKHTLSYQSEKRC